MLMDMKFRKNNIKKVKKLNVKGAASDYVATVIIVVVAVGIMALLYSWFFGFVSNVQGSSTQAGRFTACEGISYIVRECRVEPGQITFKRDINGFILNARYSDGNVISASTDTTLSAYGENVLTFNVGKSDLPEEIVIYPQNCMHAQITIHNEQCTYSNIATYSLTLSSSTTSNLNNTTASSSGVTLAQQSTSQTVTDFSPGTFFFTTLGSIKATGEVDYSGSTPTNMRLYLKMNSVASGQINDSTPNNNDALVKGTVTLTSGLWDTNAISFDGNSTNYLEVRDSPSLDVTELTMSVWIKPNAVAQGTLISKQGAYELYIENGYVIAKVNGQIVKALLSE